MTGVEFEYEAQWRFACSVLDCPTEMFERITILPYHAPRPRKPDGWRVLDGALICPAHAVTVAPAA